jgi:hypothetical protein
MLDRSRYLKAMPIARRLNPVRAATRWWLLVALLLSASAVAAPSALAAPAFYDGNSADGKVAVFSTKEQMVPGDTDQEEDVYVRALDAGLGEYVTREVSIGPKGGNDAAPAHYDGMSGDGTEVFFSTREQLVPGDTDHSEDVYVRDLVENRTILVSQGDAGCAAQNCGNQEVDSNFLPGGVAPEGGVVFFGTSERLTAGDGDSAFDIYARDIQAQTTSLVTAPDPSCLACASEGLDSQFRGTDDAGDKAFFTTAERLSSADTDSGKTDIYERNLATPATKLVSVAGTCPSTLPPGQNCEPSYGGASADGSHVFFETNERLSGEDTDSSQDVYDWAGGGTAALASIGPDGGNGEPNVTYAGSSPSGSIVYFETSEALDASADTDLSQDVYQRSGGVTTVVSRGEGLKGNLAIPASFEWASRTGSPVVVFTTAEALTAEDTDTAQDVYKRSGGVTTLVSIGPDGGNGGSNAVFAGASDDGSRIFFATTESLVPADTDSSQDIYMRSGTETVLVSAGQVGGNGAFSAGLRGVSGDGSRAFFTTQERLTVDDDFAGESDVYSWSGAGTLLVSVKNSPDLVLGPPPPSLEGTNPASPNPSTTPAIFGQGAAGSLIKVYSTFDCSGKPVAQGPAAQLASPGLTITAPVPLGSTTNFRATAEVEGIVSPCSGAIPYRQEDAPPPPTEEGGGGGGGGGGTGGTGGTGSPGGTGSAGGSGGPTGGSHGGVAWVAPLLRITFGPASKTRLRRPTFRFTDATEQPGTKFFCRVDKRSWVACGSPTKVKKLKLGRHVFALKAVNAVGTPSPAPVKRAFKVVAG